MVFKKLLCYFVVYMSFITSFAQVNLQTGSATFNIPMFDWQDSKSRLYSNISINYNSGNGLKVNDIASNIGQGWNLIGGGMITRIQVGQPDDQKPFFSGGTESSGDILKYPAGFLYTTVDPKKGCPPALTRYPLYGNMNSVYAQHNQVAEDRQFDYFAFQFNGKVGMFIIDPADGGKIMPVGDTKVKFSFVHDLTLVDQGIRTTITSFTIQDVDGLIYRFSTKGLTKILKNDYCDATLNKKFYQPNLKNQRAYSQVGFDVGPSVPPFINSQMANPYVVNSWYLTEIEDPFTNRKILYNYTDRNMNNLAGADINYQETDGSDFVIVMHKRSVTKTPQLSSITYPDGHNVLLEFGAERTDLKGDSILKAVDINYKGRDYSRFELRSSYFISNRYGKPTTAIEKSKARLCLRGVTKIGADNKDDSPPYDFDYYLGSSNPDDYVPPPYSYAADIWGYYNGNNSKGYNVGDDITLGKFINYLTFSELIGLCYLREGVTGIVLNPKSGYAKNGLLKQVIYPTGGTLTYEYEQNMGNLSGERMIGGVHVSKTLATDNGGSNGCANPIVTNFNYVLIGSTLSSIWGIEMPVNSIANVNEFKAEKKYFTWGGGDCTLFGCCKYKFQFPGIMSQDQRIDLSVFRDAMNILAPVMGIMSIVSTTMDVISYVTGGATPWSIVISIISDLATLVLSCTLNNEKTVNSTTYFNADLNQSAPLPSQFKRVEVIEGSGASGKTVHEFTNSEDFALYYPDNPYFSARQRFASWAYGLPKTTTYFDANSYKVKETINEYTFFSFYLKQCDIHGCPVPSPLPTTLVSCNCDVEINKSQRITDWSDPLKYGIVANYQTVNNSQMNVQFYGAFTGRTELNRTLERTYKKNSSTEYLENETSFNYNSSSNFEVQTIYKKQSDGKILIKEIKYTADFNNGILATLVANNVVALPVLSRTSVYANPTAKYLSEEVTEFVQLTNGNIKPLRSLEQRFTEPTPANLITFYSGPGSANSNHRVTQQFTYDAVGNLIGLKDEGGRIVTNIYGYDDKFVIASVINADPVLDKVAYTSFEDGGADIPNGYNFGGWLVTGQSTVSFSSSPSVTSTGTFGLKPSGANNLSVAGLNTSKQYTLSFWSDRTTLSISGGAILKKTGPTFNGFTFREYEVPQGTTNLTISNSGAILMGLDELRIYPADARMKTISYHSMSTADLLFGRKSECDENNRISHFEFDPLGRPVFIKDEAGNILKMYDYNTVSDGKRTGCPTIYYNKLITETFVKASCSAGYAGSEVNYIIPANTYSSTLSQEDADTKAQNDLLLNGQAYANTNGTCQLIYYNTLQSGAYTKQNCDVGYNGASISYQVPAGSYSSLVSQSDANQLAIDDIEANGQAYANEQIGCTLVTDPIWDFIDEDSTYCLSVGGQLPAHQFIKETNINPNSSTFGQNRWSDIGPQAACPANTYFNAEQVGVFTKNNCSSGTGSNVTYKVPPGKYSSLVSQADANQQAVNDLNANGQNYANLHGICLANIQITSNNTRTFSYDVRFTNNSTGQIYNFTAAPTFNGNLGVVVSGNYTVYICPINNYVPNNNYNIGSNFITGVVCATFYNISVTAQTEVRIY